jgi:hypothetical protein
MEELKVWWVLAWNDYYPSSGLGNLRETFSTWSEAHDYAGFLRSNDSWSSYDNVEIVNVSDYLG